MFTSRAEYRTLLRQDNADLRLSDLGFRIGLAKQDRHEITENKRQKVQEIKKILAGFDVDQQTAGQLLAENNSAQLSEKTKALKLLLRPGIGLKEMIAAIPALREKIGAATDLVLEQAEIQIKYDIYIEKEQELVTRMATLENLMIPESFNYEKLTAMSTEARQKLNKIKPRTLGQASRISGVNPSDVQILMVYMG